MKWRTVTWTYTETVVSDDDDAVEFTDASAPVFLTELDEEEFDADVPDQPDPIIGFRRSES